MLRTLLLFCAISSLIFAQNGLGHLNTLRAKSGLIRLKQNRMLDRASLSHAKYLIRHQKMSHNENRGRGGYTGATPSQRVIGAGYPSRVVMENLTVNTKGEKASIDNLFSAIYHRFVFLSLDKDEIGFGIAQNNQKFIKRVSVYDVGSSRLSALCGKSFAKSNGLYMKSICKQEKKMIPKKLFDKEKDKIRAKNQKIIVYPYPNQTKVSPVFYDEIPDPLPDYKVSGYPVSIQFNPYYYKKVKLSSFRLYLKGKEIKGKILQKSNDHNHLLGALEFALMPLQRLEYGSHYTAIVKATVEGKPLIQKWKFRTLKPSGKLYRIKDKKSRLKVKVGETAILYFVPLSRYDILKSVRSKGIKNISLLDQNTVRITFPKKASKGRISLDLGRRKIIFDVE